MELSVNAPSQWETTLHCNVVSHWVGGAYPKWSLVLFTLWYICLSFTQALYLPSNKMCYKISLSLHAVRLPGNTISFWELTGGCATLLPNRLWNIRVTATPKSLYNVLISREIAISFLSLSEERSGWCHGFMARVNYTWKLPACNTWDYLPGHQRAMANGRQMAPIEPFADKMFEGSRWGISWAGFGFVLQRWSEAGLVFAKRNRKTSYRKISWSLEVARLDVVMFVSLWNMTSISAALLPRCLSNFKAMGKPKPESRSFKTSRDLAVRRE